MHALCVHMSGFVWTITCTFVHGFQNNLAQSSPCSGRLKVKNTLEGQVMKWSYIELVRAITSTFMHGFENNLAQIFS